MNESAPFAKQVEVAILPCDAPNDIHGVSGVEMATEILTRVWNPSALGAIEPTLDPNHWLVDFREDGPEWAEILTNMGFDGTAVSYAGVTYAIEITL